jgi:predicted small lipoprotein YifL
VKPAWAAIGLSVALAVAGLIGCGKVGPPVPPEMVGIGAKIQRDKDREKARAEEEKRREEEAAAAEATKAEAGAPASEAVQGPEEKLEIPGTPGEEEVELPPLRPIGTPR